MKFYKSEKEPNTYKITPSSLEDLYYLSRIISKNDVVEGGSFRRFKSISSGSSETLSRASSGEKKPINVRIRCETSDFAESVNKLRITGIIISGTPEEYVQAGDHHTLDIEISKHFILFKELDQLDRALIEDAKKASNSPKAVLLMIDEQQANAYSLTSRGVHLLFESSNHASKRDPSTFESIRNQHFQQILEGLRIQTSPYIVVAGPGFEGENFVKFCKNKDSSIFSKITLMHANSTEKSAVHELIKNGLLEKLTGKQKLQEEFNALELLKKSLGKSDGFAVYGIAQTTQVVQNGAASTLLVLDKYLRENLQVKELAEVAARSSIKILIFDSTDDAGSEFSAFSVAALLKYSINYLT